METELDCSHAKVLLNDSFIKPE